MKREAEAVPHRPSQKNRARCLHPFGHILRDVNRHLRNAAGFNRALNQSDGPDGRSVKLALTTRHQLVLLMPPLLRSRVQSCASSCNARSERCVDIDAGVVVRILN